LYDRKLPDDVVSAEGDDTGGSFGLSRAIRLTTCAAA
jgi:hypothetical protein